MKPLGDRILLEPITEVKSESGLILPNSSQKKNTGIVIEIGFKTKKIKVGDKVLYHNNAGIPIDYHGKNCLLMSEEHEVISIL